MNNTVRALLSIAGSLVVSSVACVSPDELEQTQSVCGGERFDAPGRDRFCSGEVQVLALSAPGLVPQGEGPVFVQLGAGGLTVTRLTGEQGALRINAFALSDAAGSEEAAAPPTWAVWEAFTADLGGQAPLVVDSPLESFQVQDVARLSVLGVDRLDVLNQRLTAALVDGGGALSFVDLSGESSAERYALEEGVVRAPGWSSVPCEASRGFEFGQIAPFQTLNSAGWYRRYMAAATPCGLFIFGKGPLATHRATILAQLPVDVEGIGFDLEQRRVFMAAGRRGLQVAHLATLEQRLNADYDALWPPLRFPARVDERGEPVPTCDPTAPPEANDGCVPANTTGCPPGAEDCTDDESGGDDPSLIGEEPPVPLFESAGFDEVVDASQQDGVNVTHVDFSAERVFFVNDDSASSGRTTVVSGRLTPANTLDTRQSVEVEGLDLELEFARFALAPLNGSLFALVRQGWDGEAMRLRVDVYDAPEGHDPALVTTLPLRDGALAALPDGSGGGIVVVYEGSVELFAVSAEGDPL